MLGAVVNDMPGRRSMPRTRGTLRIFDPMLGSKKELTSATKVELVD